MKGIQYVTDDKGEKKLESVKNRLRKLQLIARTKTL